MAVLEYRQSKSFITPLSGTMSAETASVFLKMIEIDPIIRPTSADIFHYTLQRLKDQTDTANQMTPCQTSQPPVLATSRLQVPSAATIAASRPAPMSLDTHEASMQNTETISGEGQSGRGKPKPVGSTYADNLRGSLIDHGLSGQALHRPIKRDTHSGLVGDVAFFADNGDYTWLWNAFYPGVHTNHYIVIALTKIGASTSRVATVGSVRARISFDRTGSEL
jgi:serine/threonine protein kinase